jgi:hypothetical protein
MDDYNDLIPNNTSSSSSAGDYSDLIPKSGYEQVIQGIKETPVPSTGVVGPMFAAGAGETIKGVGALTELAFPETGKKIAGVGEALTERVKKESPIAGTIGQFGSYLLPYGAATKGVEFITGGPAKSLLPKMLQTGTAAGATGYATTPDKDDRTMSAVIGTALGVVGEPVAKGLTKAYETLTKAFGTDAKKLAEMLRDYASRTSGKEADNARRLAETAESKAAQAESRAGMAETAAQKQEREAGLALREQPGVKTKLEAGEYKPVPTESIDIGTRIRNYADEVYTKLKNIRDRNAKTFREEAFGDALTKERAGQRVSQTDAFAKSVKEIDEIIKNPETGLTNVVGETKAALEKVKNQLSGKMVDEATGTVIEKPLSFEGLENLRRMLRDRAYGLPQTGFDAIGQQQAGKLAAKVDEIMKDFSPKMENFLKQYAKDSEPMRVFQSKIGKALMDEQLLGKGANYASVAPENIPKKIFGDSVSFQSFVDATGGNRAFAENEAKKYFVSQLEKFAGDPQKVANFIRDNRTMLNLTNASEAIEAYAARVGAATRRGAAAKRAGETERSIVQEQAQIAEKQRTISKKYENLTQDLSDPNITTPKDIAEKVKQFATEMRDKDLISQKQLSELTKKSEEVLLALGQTTEAKREVLYKVIPKILGYGVVGTGGYYGAKGLMP